MGVVLGLQKKSVAAIGVLTTPFVFALVPFASTPETQWVGNARYFYWFTPFIALTIAALARKVAGTVAVAGVRDDHDRVGLLRGSRPTTTGSA